MGRGRVESDRPSSQGVVREGGFLGNHRIRKIVCCTAVTGGVVLFGGAGVILISCGGIGLAMRQGLLPAVLPLGQRVSIGLIAGGVGTILTLKVVGGVLALLIVIANNSSETMKSEEKNEERKIEKALEPKKTDPDSIQAQLEGAISKGDIDDVKKLITKKNAEVNKDILHLAVEKIEGRFNEKIPNANKDSIGILKLLLKQYTGERLRAKFDNDATIVVKFCPPKVAELFFEKAMKLKIKYLDIALAHEKIDVFKYLINQKPEILNEVSPYLRSNLLHYAVENNSIEAVNFILGFNLIDVNAQTVNGHTPLHFASGNGNKQIVEALLKAGAKKEMTTKDGQSAADLASSEEIREIINGEVVHSS